MSNKYWLFEPESTSLDKKIAKDNSPDLNELNPIIINSKLVIYVTNEKLKKYGKQHFIDKYTK